MQRLRKTCSAYLAVFCSRNSNVGPDFHGFHACSSFALWIWLESQAALGCTVIFLTPSSDPKPVSSQPVNDESPVSIAVGTISEASTGICYYYCIYIDISLYILRRSTRQAFETGLRIICDCRFGFTPLGALQKRNQFILWFCGES